PGGVRRGSRCLGITQDGTIGELSSLECVMGLAVAACRGRSQARERAIRGRPRAPPPAEGPARSLSSDVRRDTGLTRSLKTLVCGSGIAPGTEPSVVRSVKPASGLPHHPGGSFLRADEHAPLPNPRYVACFAARRRREKWIDTSGG